MLFSGLKNIFKIIFNFNLILDEVMLSWRHHDNWRYTWQQKKIWERKINLLLVTFGNFWLTIQNTTNRHVSNAFDLIVVFILFPLARCAREELTPRQSLVSWLPRRCRLLLPCFHQLRAFFPILGCCCCTKKIKLLSAFGNPELLSLSFHVLYFWYFWLTIQNTEPIGRCETYF